MTETELREMRRNLDDQYKKDRETLDRMIDLVSRSNGPDTSTARQHDPTRGMTINERIAHYVLEIEDNFTMQEAKKYIQEKDPKFAVRLKEQSMSTALWKMKKAGDIKIIIPKKGKSAAIYSKK